MIYADVLFILNAYITYALLLLTALISGVKAKRVRLTLSALLGGVYSLIILIPNISDSLITLSRLPAALIFIFVAFYVADKKVFIRLFCSFFLVNFIFAGLMLALWYFICPQNMYLGGFVVYLDIEPVTIVALTALCYFLIKGINAAVKIKQPKGTIFDITMHINNITVKTCAFYDTGNSLCDPFTGKQVIIVSRSALTELFPVGTTVYDKAVSLGMNVRFLPCSGIGGSALLPCIKAQRVHIKSLSVSVYLEEALIAVTEEKIKGGAFGALLNKDIFSEKGEDYDDKAKETFYIGKK